MLAATHELDDASLVRLRLTRPSDAALVPNSAEEAGHLDEHHLSLVAAAGLVPEHVTGPHPQLFRRFLLAMPTVSESTVRHFTFYDPRERMTFAAMALEDGSERMVGVADAAFLETGLAEIGVVVDDSHQGRGVGKLLSEAVASLAIKRGATHLKAQMLSDNVPMLRLFERLGRTVRAIDDGTSTAYVRLSADGRRSAA